MADVKPIPEGMHTITPHIVCKDAARAIDFYRRAFGAIEIARQATPDGSVVFRIRDPAAVSRYRFGLRTADFLVCRACGIYVGAVMERAGRQWAIVNLRASEFYDVPVAAVSYDAENEAGRFDRRRTRWTPVRARAGE